jgi:DNA polymerase
MMNTMRYIHLEGGHDFAEWRDAARVLLRDGVAPDEVVWVEAGAGEGDLLSAGAPRSERVSGRAVGVVPRRFLVLARLVLGGDEPDRFALLYRLLWRLQKDKGLLSRPWDVDVGKLNRRVDAAREVNVRNPASAPTIVAADEVEEAAMASPQTSARVARRGNPDVMAPAAEAAEAITEIGSLAAARAAVDACTRCELYKFATQAVFGEGPAHAPIMLVGEQPGDQEDLVGRPFVGPAGRVLAAALEAAGIARKAVYVTNAVKHFKFTPRGKKRIHKRPDRGEIVACKFWLDLERDFVRPKVVVAMGATAAQSLLGKAVAISGTRGAPIRLPDGGTLFVTIHPSFLLRMRSGGGGEDVAAARTAFEDDLRRAAAFAAQAARPARKSA